MDLALKNIPIPKEFSDPFDSSLIEKRQDGMRYVDPIHYRKKLQDVVGLNYDFENKGIYFPTPDYVVVTVSITVYLEDGTKLIKTGSSGAAIVKAMREKKGKQVEVLVVDHGTAVKIAESNAFKRACMDLGIGLELYDKEDNHGGHGSNYTYGASSKQISENQINYILKLKSMNRLTDDNMVNILKAIGIETDKIPKQFTTESLKPLTMDDARKIIDTIKDSNTLKNIKY